LEPLSGWALSCVHVWGYAVNRIIVAALDVIVVWASLVTQVWAQGISQPSVHVLGSDGSSTSLKFDIGYLTYKNPVVREITCDAHQTRLEFPLQGLWPAAVATRTVSDRLEFVGKGTWLVPFRGQASEALGHFVPPPWPKATRSWSTHPQWYTIDGAVRYSLSSALSGIAGFRLDAFGVGFRNPADITGSAALLPSDEADCACTSYIPYVGLMVNYGSAFTVSLIGTPRLAGVSEFRETFGADTRWDGKGSLNRGYFLEFCTEYGANVSTGRLALMLKWTALYTSAPLHVDVFSTGNPFVHSSPKEPFSLPFALDRRNWIIGASYSMEFASPL